MLLVPGNLIPEGMCIAELLLFKLHYYVSDTKHYISHKYG